MMNTFSCAYGDVTVRNIIIPIEFNGLEEGLEIKGEEIGVVEAFGYKDIDDLTVDDVEKLIEDNQ